MIKKYWLITICLLIVSLFLIGCGANETTKIYAPTPGEWEGEGNGSGEGKSILLVIDENQVMVKL